MTTCVKTLEVLVKYPPSPPYTAVMECEPIVSALVLYVATPELTVPVPKVLVPSLNVTVPVAAAAVPVGELVLTVAVKVTKSPFVEGFKEVVKLVVVVCVIGAFTVWLKALELLVP